MSSWQVGLGTLVGEYCRVVTVKIEVCHQSGMLRTLKQYLT